MKPFTNFSWAKWLLCFSLVLFTITACRKDVKHFSSSGSANEDELTKRQNQHGHLQQTKTFSAEVAIRWLNMQLNMLRVPLATGATAPEASRALAYSGIALYEAVEPGMPQYQSLGGQLNALPLLPTTDPGYAYHWAASANAALAYISRNLFSGASAENKTAIDALETELQNEYATEVDAATLDRSIAFGRAVAEIVFNWGQTDGSLTSPPPSTYVIPVGPGLWEKTPPNFAGPVNPFASQRRLIVQGSDEGVTLDPPPTYSTDPGSAFFAMVKDVYDRSLVLTPAQTAMAIYHRDAPGYPGGGALLAMLAQALQQSACKLDVAALAYSKLGIASFDAGVVTFIKKYTVNLVRPITYIRNVLGHPTWNALFATPGHPEFPSAHGAQGGAISIMLTDELGENFNLTLDHYNYIGLPARNYASFDELGNEMANSRVFAGIHYQASCDKGVWLGKKVSSNILSKIHFKK